MKALENGNEDLISLLEKCDEKIQKTEEDFRVCKMKCEKYEAELEARGLADKRIDVESLDGRINFLVNTLEEYRRILEEDSQFNDPARAESEEGNEYMTPIRYSTRSLQNNVLDLE